MMLVMRKQLALSVEDLGRVAIRCNGCGTEVVLDFKTYKPFRDRHSFAPRNCPSCGLEFDSAFQQLNALQEAYAALIGFQERLTFYVDAHPAD